MHTSLLGVLIHAAAFAMALLEFLLRCFRRRSPASDQKRPLCTEEDSAQDDDSQLITEQPVHPVVEASPRLSVQHDSPSEHCDVEAYSSFGFTEGATLAQVLASSSTQQICSLYKVSTLLDSFIHTMPLKCQTLRIPMQVGGESATALPPTPVLKANPLASNPEQADNTSPPLEMRTRNIIARTPVAGPSPASGSPASAPTSAGVTPLSLSTPQSNLHQVSLQQSLLELVLELFSSLLQQSNFMFGAKA